MTATWMAPLTSRPEIVHAWARARWTGPATDHHLDGLWQLHAYGGPGELAADTPQGPLRVALIAGAVSLLPPGTRSRYRAMGREPFACLHLRWPAGPTAAPVRSLVAGDPLLTGLVHTAAATANPDEAAITAWSALWRLAAAARPTPSLVERAVDLLERRLDDPPAVTVLAASLGCSAAHLRRAFAQHFGQGVKPWIQARRAARAQHLLRHTDLALAEIARQVGITSPQQFNKLLRRQVGLPPRVIRRGST